MPRARRLVAAAALALACAGSPARAPGPGPDAEVRFTGAAAMAELTRVMALPRALGAAGRGRAIDALEARLRAIGAAGVDRLDHRGGDPWSGEAFAMTTLIAAFRPAAPRRFILATHFDTRPWAEEDAEPARRDRPIPGANDGSSGVAVLLALAPILLRALAPEVGFWVILFDGEELGRPPAEGYCAGSRALAEALAAGEFAELRGAAFAVVIDMIGDHDLEIAPEARSLAAAPWLVDQVWSRGDRRAFVPGPPRTITDDHVALIEVGIPSILVIDRAYAAWHTHDDTIDRVSPRSLERVGEALRAAIVDLARGHWPPS